MARKKSAQSIDARILGRIGGAKTGSIYSAVHFLDIGTRAGVDQALSRLSKAGKLRRVGRGLYDIPQNHPWFGVTPATPEALVAAIARRSGLELRPSGADAANLLGLSEQVPAKTVYLTNGRSRKLRLNGYPVELRRRSARMMAMSAQPTGLIVSALQSLGRTHITTTRLTRLHHDLSEMDKQTLLRELPLAPAWMHPHLRYLATGNIHV